MSDHGEPEIVITDRRLEQATLRRLVASGFGDMVKFVVDVARGIAAVGGELHADEESALLAHGSRQEDLWGANYYPGRGRDHCVEFTSLINIRPAEGNRGMTIGDPALQASIREITYRLIGEGEPLP